MYSNDVLPNELWNNIFEYESNISRMLDTNLYELNEIFWKNQAHKLGIDEKQNQHGKKLIIRKKIILKSVFKN